jgi:hypothetical protein
VGGGGRDADPEDLMPELILIVVLSAIAYRVLSRVFGGRR